MNGGGRPVDATESILRREFEGDEGTFLFQLRMKAEWDRSAFSRLVEAMEWCARKYEKRATIDRWVAQGFWFVGDFVPACSSHPNFRKLHDDAYHEAACTRLHDLAWWLFFGESPYIGSKPLPPL